MNRVTRLTSSAFSVVFLLWGLNYPISGSFAPGVMLDPVDGLYRTARNADTFGSGRIIVPEMEDDVRLIRDLRGVPHIFAGNDRDATRSLGFVVAQDRLFEIDFISRAAGGRLAEVMGPSAVNTDRFFRNTGMAWATKRHLKWMEETGSIQLGIIDWYREGVNAYIRSLEPEDYPLEFRLLNYAPSIMERRDALLVLQYMTFDLTYRGRDKEFSEILAQLGSDSFNTLFPRFSSYFRPIVPPEEADWSVNPDRAGTGNPSVKYSDIPFGGKAGTVSEGFIFGKGSNNWAVDGNHSTTGFPILAGDMHLNLSLPAIWYEAHIVTPELNLYGVTIPGAPVIVEGFTPSTAWAFTNTGTDQIDYYALQSDSNRTGYQVDGEFLPFDVVEDTILVSGSAPVVEKRYYSRFGPVQFGDKTAIATRWVAHDSVRTLQALWSMGHSTDYESFQDATRYWDAPMQNILYADRRGTIAIRSTGNLPVRGGGVTGEVVLDGTTSANDWTGRVPFDELPRVRQPARGYLTSTNQQPTDRSYPYYLGWDWRDSYRSIRIDTLLSAQTKHSVDDMKSYQADTHPVQADLFLPLIAGLSDLTPAAERVRSTLLEWDRVASVDAVAPILLYSFLEELKSLTWDESVFRLARPSDTNTLKLILMNPDLEWFDRVDTESHEVAGDIIREALERTGIRFAASLASDPESLRWGRHHKLLLKHITRSPALRALWRGPVPFPGFRQTLSPGDALVSTASASWRVVVDFSTEPVTAYGVYPGGQSGNPFSERYASSLKTYLDFDYYDLLNVSSPDELPVSSRLHDTVLTH
jgi:penicillin G amidase